MTILDKVLRFLLAGSGILWVLFALKILRITNAIDWLVKRVGQWIVIGWMFIGVILLLVLGARMVRERQERSKGIAMLVTGSAATLAFVLMIGVPMVNSAINPISANPSTPRPLPEQTGLPVFPGAEGYGTTTIAGRDGKVIEVASLADSGPGTLRAALDDPEPRMDTQTLRSICIHFSGSTPIEKRRLPASESTEASSRGFQVAEIETVCRK